MGENSRGGFQAKHASVVKHEGWAILLLLLLLIATTSVLVASGAIAGEPDSTQPPAQETTPMPAPDLPVPSAAQIVPVLRVTLAGSNPPAGYICLYELVLDNLGTISSMQLSCADGKTKQFSTSDAETLPNGIVLKHVDETIALFIHISCDVVDLKLGPDFHTAQGGSAQLFYQQNCRKNNAWKPVAVNLVHAGSGWQVLDAQSGNAFNCLQIVKGGSGITAMKESSDDSCLFPPRAPGDPIPVDALMAGAAD